MISDAPPWSIRTALISVHDVDRSVAFYKDVMNFHDVRRDGQLAALGGDTTRPFTLLLRQAHRNAILSGQGLVSRKLEAP